MKFPHTSYITLFNNVSLKAILVFSLTLILSVFIEKHSNAQVTLKNQNGYIHINSGTSLNVGGTINLENNGQIDNSGTIDLKGDWLNNSGTGAFVNTNIGLVNFSGANQIIGGGNSTAFYNVALMGTGSKTISNSSRPSINGTFTVGVTGTSLITLINLNTDPNLILVKGEFTLNTGSTYQNNGAGLNFQGNAVFSGSFTGAKKIFFTGTSTQAISGIALTGIKSFSVNKTSGGVLLSTTVMVDSALVLSNGYIQSDNTNLLTINNGASITGASDSSFVTGPMKKVGNSAFIFPLGASSLSSGAYHPLGITAPSGTSDEFTAQYFASNQTSGSALQTDSLESISNCEYWSLSTPGTSSVITSLGWNSNSCNVSVPDALREAVWNGTEWESFGKGGLVVNGNMGLLTGQRAASPSTQFMTIGIVGFTVNAGQSKAICAGVSTLLQASVTGASGPVTYSWLPTAGLSSSTILQPTATPTVTTTYTITVTETTGLHRVGTAHATISVTPLPVVTVSPTNSAINAGSSVSLTASGANTYSWLPSTGLDVTTGATVNANPVLSTTYTVTGTLTSASLTCTNTASSVVSVNSCILVSLMTGDVCMLTPVTLSASAFKGCVSAVTMSFGDGYSVTNDVDYDNGAVVSHSYTSTGTYTITITGHDANGNTSSQTSQITINDCGIECTDCIPSFSPIPNHKYILSAWAKQSGAAPTVTNYTTPKITVSATTGSYSISFTPSGAIIDGWQKIDGEFTLPTGTTAINITLESTSGDCYFDDIRVFPFDGSMKSYVYDPISMRLVAELDERNYATLYEYDEEGKLVRVKKETERGIMTIKENRNNTSK